MKRSHCLTEIDGLKMDYEDGEEVEPPLEIPAHLKKSVPELGALVNILTCNICYDPLNNPVLTECSHSFCSVCIRRYLVYKQQCPQCGAPASDGKLRLNKIAAECSGQLRKLVSSLQAFTSSHKPVGSSQGSSGGHAEHKKTSKKVNQKENQGSPKKCSKNNAAFENEENRPLYSSPVKSSSQEESPRRDKPVLSRINSNVASLSLAPMSKLLSPPPPESDADDDGVDPLDSCSSQTRTEYLIQGRVECGKCHVLVPKRNLSLHVLQCTKEKQTKKRVEKRGPMPKLVYSLLKDPQLRKKCKELGLNSKGERRALIARHQKLCVLYNSECDLEKPRSLPELVRQVEREEAAEKSGTKAANALLKFDRNTDAASIEAHQKQYLEQNKSSFNKLINSLKQKQQSASSTAATSPSTSSTLHNDSLTSKDVDSDIEIVEWNFDNTNSDNQTTTAASKSSDGDKTLTQTPSAKENKPAPGPSGSGLGGTDKKKNSGSNATSIKSSLALSAERSKKAEKQTCPVCQTQVVERYLNIHLDKCLRSNEPEPSPIIKNKKAAPSTKKLGKKSKTARILASLASEEEGNSETTTEDDEDDDIFEPRKKRPARGAAAAKNPVVDYSDSETQDDPAEMSQNSSYMVAEPSIRDLINMGMGSKDAGERTDSSFLQDDYVHGYIRNDAGVDKAADNYEVVTADIDADISGFPLSNGLEQYTDTMSQDSYVQEDSDMFASSHETITGNNNPNDEDYTAETDIDDAAVNNDDLIEDHEEAAASTNNAVAAAIKTADIDEEPNISDWSDDDAALDETINRHIERVTNRVLGDDDANNVDNVDSIQITGAHIRPKSQQGIAKPREIERKGRKKEASEEEGSSLSFEKASIAYSKQQRHGSASDYEGVQSSQAGRRTASSAGKAHPTRDRKRVGSRAKLEEETDDNEEDNGNFGGKGNRPTRSVADVEAGDLPPKRGKYLGQRQTRLRAAKPPDDAPRREEEERRQTRRRH